MLLCLALFNIFGQQLRQYIQLVNCWTFQKHFFKSLTFFQKHFFIKIKSLKFHN